MRKKWKSWLVLAVPYLLTALIPVISVLFLSNTISINYQKNVIEDTQIRLQTAADRMRQKCDSIEQLTVFLSNSAALNRYSTACLNRSEHTSVDFLEVQNLFLNATFDPVIHDIFLYDKKDDAAISSNVALSSTEIFFRYNYALTGQTYQENIDRLDDMPRVQRYCPEITISRATTESSAKRVVEYRMFLPIGWVREMQCQLVVAMDAEKLFEDLQDAVPAGGEFYVYDGNNVLIYSNGTFYKDLLALTDPDTLHPLSYDGTSLHGTVLRSGQWKVKICIPNLVTDGNGFSFRTPSFILFVFLPMILCVLLTIFLTHKRYRNILELLNAFRSRTEEHPEYWNPKGRVDYEAVREHADRIIAQNDHYKARITDYEVSRKYEILDKLIRNTYKSPEAAAQALSEVELNIRSGSVLVLCIRNDRDSYRSATSEEAFVKDFIKLFLQEILEGQYELFDTSAMETICLMAVEDSQNAEIIVRDIISQLTVELAYRYGIEVHIGAGSPVPSLYRVCESYDQACQVLYYSEAYGAKISLYSELARMEDAYYFPRDYEEKICNYVIAGRDEEATGIIREIFAENFDKDNRIPSARAIEKLKQRLWDCVTSIADKYEISLEVLEQANRQALADSTRSKQSMKRYFAAVVQALNYLAEEIRGKRKQVQHNAAPRILDYVHENFCDPNLTVKQISAVFGMHENYVSHIFKTAYGESLSLYIERLRIEKAMEMVKNTDMMIRDIAEAVGYMSDTSFRRAFKKITGVTPGECRKP